MNKAAKKYYRNLKLLMPIHGKHEKQLLNDIRLRLFELSETSSHLTYEQICKEMGNPQEFVAEYFSNSDSEYIIRKLRVSRYIRSLIICAIVVLLVITGIRSYYLHKLYLEVQDTIVTEKTITIE